MAKDPQDTDTIDLFGKLQDNSCRQLVRTTSITRANRPKPANHPEPEPPQKQIRLFQARTGLFPFVLIWRAQWRGSVFGDGSARVKPGGSSSGA